MKIYFIRHGETEYNKNGLVTGRIDTPLIAEGIAQAEEVAAHMMDDFSKMYCSDLLRCKQTAEILNRKLNLPIMYDSRLNERDFGSLAGKKILEMDMTGEIKKKDTNQEYDYRPFGGESVDQVKGRLFSLITEILNNDTNEKVLVVTSGGIIRLLHHILHEKVQENIHNSSVHEFDFTGNSLPLF